MPILYPLLFSILLFRYYKWRHSTPLTYFIIILYFCSSIVACYLYYIGYSTYRNIDISFHSIVYLFFCLSVIITGFYYIEKQLNISIKEIQYSKIRFFIWFVIIISFISIYHSINLLTQISNMNIADIRFGYNQRNLYENTSGGLIDYLVSFGTAFYAISLFLFYYTFKYFPTKKHIIILLLISSTSIIFSNLTIAGRDGIAKWILLFLGNYLIFSKFITKKEKKQLIKIIALFITLALIIFIFITIGRFGSKPFGIINNILDYYGQGFINFSKMFDLFPDGNFFGRMTFPVFFPQNEFVSGANLNNTLFTVNYQLNVFPTIIGSFYLDFGYFFTLVVVVTLYLLFLFIKKIYINSLVYLILILYLFEALASGVFYFMNYSPAFQKMVGLLILFILIKKIIYKPAIILPKIRFNQN